MAPDLRRSRSKHQQPSMPSSTTSVRVAIALEDQILGRILAISADAITQAIAGVGGIWEGDLRISLSNVLSCAVEALGSNLDVDIDMSLGTAIEVTIDVND